MLSNPQRNELAGAAPTGVGPGPAGQAPPMMRALGFGALLVAILASVVLLVGHASLGWMPAEALPYYGAGIAAALFAATLALWIHGRFLDGRHHRSFATDGRLMASRFQALLAAAFGAKLGVLLLAVLVLRVNGTKFELMATFCVSFAVVALVCQLAIATYLSRAMSKRWRTSGQNAIASAAQLSQTPKAP